MSTVRKIQSVEQRMCHPEYDLLIRRSRLVNNLLASGELVSTVTLPQRGQIPITWAALLPLQSAFMGTNRSLDRQSAR
jgi:hypothetical protein